MIPIILVLLAFIWPSSALAGWWLFGKPSAWEKSGLDLRQGYDQNTVIALNGTVVRVDLGDDRSPALAVVKTETETVSLVLGPRDFWQQQGISLNPGDPVSVRGSKAQGQDGVVYLMVQSLSTSGSPQETTLRNRTGRPVWSAGPRPPHQTVRPMRQIRSGRNH
jgi:hypothetical protein